MESIDSAETKAATPKKSKASSSGSSVPVNAIVNEMYHVLTGPETPEKTSMRGFIDRVGTAAGLDPGSSGRLKLGHRYVRVRRKQVGRPIGSVKVEDSKLYEQLERYSSPTSVVHDKTQIPIRTLDMSKGRLADRLKEDDGVALRKSQLCHRIRRCRLAVAPHSVARGKCDACCSWTQFGRNRVEHLLTECRSTIQAVVPSYFTDWLYQVKQEGLDSYELPKQDNVDYVEGLLVFLNSQRDRHQCSLGGEEQITLAALEQQSIDNLTAELEDLRNIAWHWALRRSVDSLWQSHWDTPRCRVLYGLWDHMAPQFFTTTKISNKSQNVL